MYLENAISATSDHGLVANLILSDNILEENTNTVWHKVHCLDTKMKVRENYKLKVEVLW